jgi:hypothetical protein
MGGGLSRRNAVSGNLTTTNGGSTGSSSFSLRRVDSTNSDGDSVCSKTDNGPYDEKQKLRHLFERDDSDDELSCSSSVSDKNGFQGALLCMTKEDEEMLKEVLSRFCYIESGMSTSTLNKVVSSMDLESLSVGQCLLRVGEMGDKLYVVNDGELSVTINGRHIRTVRRKYVLGELAILYNEPRTATVVAGDLFTISVLNTVVLSNARHFSYELFRMEPSKGCVQENSVKGVFKRSSTPYKAFN